ncbi:2-dehydro-3-deoxygluconokinase [compost metagenome]
MAPDATVMLTRGAEGMTLFKGSATVEQPALRVEVADTVGCGDAAMGGWMAGVLSGAAQDLAAQARLAAAAAAVAATRAGAYPPSRDEVEGLITATR